MPLKRSKPDTTVQTQSEQTITPERAAFLRSNEIEKANLDREIAQLERKLGIAANDRKRRRLNQVVEEEGFGKGFMQFVDGIEQKVKGLVDYKP